MNRLFISLLFVSTCFHLQGQKVERFLNQGKSDKAIAYCEKQAGEDRTDCFMAIGDYYLNKSEYTVAEAFYHKSGKIETGYLNIAKSYMKGEVVDTTLKINIPKAEEYLKKVFTDETLVFSEMASCFEEYAYKENDRLKLIKTMDDMGIISMSIEGKFIDIKRASVSVTNFLIQYCNYAIKYYEKTGDSIKADELRNLIPQAESS